MEKQRQEVDVTKGLMKQTKAQLVEIILRKDERERELLSEIKSLKFVKSDNSKEEFDKLKEEITNKNKHIKHLMTENNNLRSDFEGTCDVHATEIAEYKNKCRLYNLAIYIMAAVAILSLLFGYMGI